MPYSFPRSPNIVELIDEHQRWLSNFHPQYLVNWNREFDNDEEAALAEARVRRLIQGYGIDIHPNEDLTGVTRQPDFRCFRDSYKFYVEVTCISIETAIAKTGIPIGNHKLIACGSLTPCIFSECKSKASQCGNLDSPALVAIGTFHTSAAMDLFEKPIISRTLTGETKIAWTIDPQTGCEDGETHQITELESAAFLRPDDTEEVGYARNSISGLLLCSLNSNSFKTIGILHPNPARSFDATILPDIEFGQVILDRISRELHVSWSGGSEK